MKAALCACACAEPRSGSAHFHSSGTTFIRGSVASRVRPGPLSWSLVAAPQHRQHDTRRSRTQGDACTRAHADQSADEAEGRASCSELRSAASALRRRGERRGERARSASSLLPTVVPQYNLVLLHAHARSPLTRGLVRCNTNRLLVL